MEKRYRNRNYNNYNNYRRTEKKYRNKEERNLSSPKSSSSSDSQDDNKSYSSYSFDPLTDTSPFNKFDPTINVAVIGCINAGKSTFINALLSEKINNTSINTCTRYPYIFVESDEVNFTPEYASDVFSTITKLNVGTMQSNSSECFAVKPIMDIQHNTGPKEIKISLWDIPGYNDVAFNSKVLKEFWRFNIVILMIDIENGFLTTDEEKLLKTILVNINENIKNGFNTKLMLIINKSDKYVKNADYLNNHGKVNKDIQSKCENIERTLKTKSNELCKNLDYKIVYMSCKELYVYRLVKLHKLAVLDENDLDTLVKNEFGSKVTNDDYELSDINGKRSYVATKINHEVCDARINETGINAFKRGMEYFLSNENKYSFLMNHMICCVENIINMCNDYECEKNNTIAEVKKYRECIDSIRNKYEHDDRDSYFDRYIKATEKYINVYISKYSDFIKLNPTITNKNLEILQNLQRKITDIKKQLCCEITNYNTPIEQITNEMCNSINRYYIDEIQSEKCQFEKIIENYKKLRDNEYDIRELREIVKNKASKLSIVTENNYKTLNELFFSNILNAIDNLSNVCELSADEEIEILISNIRILCGYLVNNLRMYDFSGLINFFDFYIFTQQNKYSQDLILIKDVIQKIKYSYQCDTHNDNTNSEKLNVNSMESLGYKLMEKLAKQYPGHIMSHTDMLSRLRLLNK